MLVVVDTEGKHARLSERRFALVRVCICVLCVWGGGGGGRVGREGERVPPSTNPQRRSDVGNVLCGGGGRFRLHPRPQPDAHIPLLVLVLLCGASTTTSAVQCGGGSRLSGKGASKPLLRHQGVLLVRAVQDQQLRCGHHGDGCAQG